MLKIKCKLCKKSISESQLRNHTKACKRMVTRNCLHCEKPFRVAPHMKKVTCSKLCTNKHFRTGKKYENTTSTKHYRYICFQHHEKKCVVCGEDKIVAVHHFDENKKNNHPRNLIPLCPTHHEYVHHNKWKHLVLPKIEAYLKKFRVVRYL